MRFFSYPPWPWTGISFHLTGSQSFPDAMFLGASKVTSQIMPPASQPRVQPLFRGAPGTFTAACGLQILCPARRRPKYLDDGEVPPPSLRHPLRTTAELTVAVAGPTPAPASQPARRAPAVSAPRAAARQGCSQCGRTKHAPGKHRARPQ